MLSKLMGRSNVRKVPNVIGFGTLHLVHFLSITCWPRKGVSALEFNCRCRMASQLLVAELGTFSSAGNWNVENPPSLGLSGYIQDISLYYPGFGDVILFFGTPSCHGFEQIYMDPLV